MAGSLDFLLFGPLSKGQDWNITLLPSVLISWDMMTHNHNLGPVKLRQEDYSELEAFLD